MDFCSRLHGSWKSDKARGLSNFRIGRGGRKPVGSNTAVEIFDSCQPSCHGKRDAEGGMELGWPFPSFGRSCTAAMNLFGIL